MYGTKTLWLKIRANVNLFYHYWTCLLKVYLGQSDKVLTSIRLWHKNTTTPLQNCYLSPFPWKPKTSLSRRDVYPIKAVWVHLVFHVYWNYPCITDIVCIQVRLMIFERLKKLWSVTKALKIWNEIMLMTYASHHAEIFTLKWWGCHL